MSSTRKSDRPQLDLRTVWLASGAWLAALWLTAESLELTLLVLICGAFLCVVFLWVLFKNVGLISWFAPMWSPLALALAGVTVIAGVVAIQHQNTLASPIMEYVEKSASVRIQFTLEETPRAVTMNERAGPESTGVVHDLSNLGPDGQPQKNQDNPNTEGHRKPPNSWLATVTVERFSVEGKWLSANHTGTLVLSGKVTRGVDVEKLKRGDSFEALAKLSPADPGRRSVMWVRPLIQLEALEASAVSGFPAWVEEIRAIFGESASALPGDGPALLPGMVMGDRSGQDEALEKAMKDAGLAHLTAVSGANCSLILGFIALLLRSLRLPRWSVVVGCLLGLLAFVFIVYPEPSVVRAAVMGSIAAVAVFAGRARQALAALGVSVTLLLVLDPYFGSEPAFQLSVCATAGIVVIGRPLAKLLAHNMPEWLGQALAVALAAQIACLPVLTLLAPQFSTWSTIANIVVGPLIPFITVLGTLALLLGAVSPMLQVPLVWVAGLLSAAVGELGRWFAQLPFAVLEWPSGPPGAFVAVAVTALTAFGLWNVRRPFVRALLLTGSFAVLVAALVPVSKFASANVGEWDIAMCDVGQGDGFVIKTGERQAIVVDSGPEPELMDLCLTQLGIDTVPVFFVTHLHADHAGGIGGVLKDRKVDMVLYSTAEPNGLTGASSQLPVIQKAHAGESGFLGAVSWTVIAPAEKALTENDASLVVHFKVSDWSFLTTGDIESDAMSAVIRDAPESTLVTDILKVSHHGAKNGGTAILQESKPKLALISVGADNTYGHPSPNIMEKLSQLQIPVARTDQDGLVLLKIMSETELNYFSVPSGTRIE